MTPYAKAVAVYRRELCARSFAEDLQSHLANGYVFSTPELFAMGRPVCKDAPKSLILDPTVRFDNPDCWLCWLFSGNLLALTLNMPYWLPWIAFERRNVLRFYKTEDFKRGLWKSFASQPDCQSPFYNEQV